MEGFHDRFGNAQTISATIRRRAAGEGSSVFSKCRGRRRRAGGCGRCCDTHGRPGAHANIWERQEGIFAACQSKSRYQAPKQSATLWSRRSETANFSCTRYLRGETWQGARVYKRNATPHNQRQGASRKRNYTEMLARGLLHAPRLPG